MSALTGLEPASVFYYFEEICGIPHTSHHEKALSDYCVQFAKAHGLACRQDEMGNVLIKAPATPGYEKEPGLILQGHLDMVGDKTPFRENEELHATLLDLMRTYPYMAHNAAFEDSWFALNLPGYAEARKAGDITVVDTRDLCRGLDPDVKRLPFNTKPASLESWARRRGTLSNDANEVHLGLDDTDLMLKTVCAEFELRGIL